MILVLGIISLVTSIVGIFFTCCCAILSPVFHIAALACGITAWVMGNKDLPILRAGAMDPTGLSTTNTGRILAIVGVVIAIIGVLLFAANIVFVIFSLANDPAFNP